MRPNGYFDYYRVEEASRESNNTSTVLDRDLSDDKLASLFEILRQHPDRVDKALRAVSGPASTARTAGSDGRASWDTVGSADFRGTYIDPPAEGDGTPRKWPGASEAGESIVAFLEREYRDFLGRGLNRVHLSRRDQRAANALRDWESSRKRRWLWIPTLPEYNDAMFNWMDRIGDAGAKAKLPKEEYVRLLRARASRRFNNSKLDI